MITDIQMQSNETRTPSPTIGQMEPKSELEIDVKHFLIALRQAGRSPETIEKYEWQLNRLLHWLAERNVTRLADISRPLLREWGAHLYELDSRMGGRIRMHNNKPKKWEPATIRHAISIARSFLSWCYRERMIPDDLAQTLQLPKIRKRIQRTPDAQEIQAIINTCDLKTLKGIRDVALVSLLTDSGLRSREIRQLPIKNVQLGVKVDGIPVNLLIVDGKGDDEEPAFFGQATAERLRAWLEVRPAAPDVDTLFVSIGGSTPGQPFTRHGLRTTLIKLGQQAGVEGTTPHAFRRSFACIADEAGASTRTIQCWGRWSDIKMVERYTGALKAGKKYNKYSPMDYIETLED